MRMKRVFRSSRKLITIDIHIEVQPVNKGGQPQTHACYLPDARRKRKVRLKVFLHHTFKLKIEIPL